MGPSNIGPIKHVLIDWCLTPTLAVFWLYRGVNKFLHSFKYKCKKYTKSRQIEIVNELQLKLYALHVFIFIVL
jgi:hypothetical protein